VFPYCHRTSGPHYTGVVTYFDWWISGKTARNRENVKSVHAEAGSTSCNNSLRVPSCNVPIRLECLQGTSEQQETAGSQSQHAGVGGTPVSAASADCIPRHSRVFAQARSIVGHLQVATRGLYVFALLALCTGFPAYAQPKKEEPLSLLRKYAHFSQADEAEWAEGAPVVKLLGTSRTAEYGLLGVVRVRCTADHFIGRLRDIASFKKSKEVLQIGKFQSPPILEDLDALSLEPEDLESMKKCRIGDCNLKMGGRMIERLHNEMDWQSADFSARANRLYREILFEYLTAYLKTGNEALVKYSDKREAVGLADEFYALLNALTFLNEYAPEFSQYLREFPESRPGEAEDFVYWSKEKFGFKAVISLTHVFLYRPAGSKWTFVASKQIYANHYFLGSLALTLFADTPTDGTGQVSSLIYVNRSSADLGGGLFSGVLRFIIRRRLVEGLDKFLLLTRDRLEETRNGR